MADEAKKPKYPVKEKIEGVYEPNGETVKFNKTWGQHTFTDEEAQALLKGETIEFDTVSKAQKPYKAKGTLEQLEYNGSKYWGFEPDFAKKQRLGEDK